MIVDASVWVASILDQDIHHSESTAFVRRLIELRQSASVPALAWPEISGAVSRRAGDAERGIKVAEFLAAQSWISSFPLDSMLARDAMRIAAGQRIRGADAVYVALAATRRLALITLDAEMLERAPAGVECLSPADWLQRNAL